MIISVIQHRILWVAIFTVCLLPLPYILYQGFSDNLGAEPAKALVEFLGETSIVLLLATLAITPLGKIGVIPKLVKYRRMVGLYVFFYAVLHLASYAFLLVDWDNFVEDLYQRIYVMFGAAAFLILFALTITSPKFMLRKLGKRWKLLHRCVYPAAILVVVHVWWQVRSDYAEAVAYAAVLFVLLLFRWRVLLKPFLSSK